MSQFGAAQLRVSPPAQAGDEEPARPRRQPRPTHNVLPARRRQHFDSSSIAFGLFILVNATLFLRPSELVEGLEQFPIYRILIIACLLLALPAVIRQLNPKELRARPITLCIVVMLVMVFVSSLLHANLFLVRVNAIEFTELLVYYLLLVALITTPERMRKFLFCLTFFIAGLTVIALLQYHHIINIPSLEEFIEHADADNPDGIIDPDKFLVRLCSTGLFNDPNDLCLILTFGAVSCLYWFRGDVYSGARRQKTGLRWHWLPPVTIFLYALFLTHSRGGFLALLVAISILLISSIGWKRALPIGAILIALLLVAFAGRQTNISANDETAQDRMKLWSDGIEQFKTAPIWGIGMNQYVEQVGMVAHNSFLHAFVELGYVGGVGFLSAFLYGFWSLHRMGRAPIAPALLQKYRARGLKPPAPPLQLPRLRAHLIAIVAAYITGYLSLSRCYVPSTYLVLGLCTAYANIQTSPLAAPPKASWKLVRNALLFGVLYMIGIYCVIRVMVHWS